MGVMDMRIVITLLSFVAFIGIVVWAYSGHSKKRFDEAANLPFADDEMQQRTIEQARTGRENSSSGSTQAGEPQKARSTSGKEVSHG
ncbi:MAG: cbb3-type cytochrome c oxidase subunit 3 [Granulosicoccus sp.]|nr:cbb3-type cytochrome c oxidase subunit 3 [Granulosicoccus sp.]